MYFQSVDWMFFYSCYTQLINLKGNIPCHLKMAWFNADSFLNTATLSTLVITSPTQKSFDTFNKLLTHIWTQWNRNVLFGCCLNTCFCLIAAKWILQIENRNEMLDKWGYVELIQRNSKISFSELFNFIN